MCGGGVIVRDWQKPMSSHLTPPVHSFSRVTDPDHALLTDIGPVGLQILCSPHTLGLLSHIYLNCVMEPGLLLKRAMCSWQHRGYVAGFHFATGSITRGC